MQKMGVAAAVLAVPQGLFVPREEGGLSIVMVENIQGRQEVVKDHPIQQLILRGNVESPGPYEVLKADPVLWYATRVMSIPGIRVFGGEIAGRPWSSYAAFSYMVTLNNGDTLNVNYTLTVGDYGTREPR